MKVKVRSFREFEFRDNNKLKATGVMESPKFDLLQNDSNIFRVSFDFYTPRPHFSILPKIKIEPDFSGLTHEQVSQLVEAAKTTLEIGEVDHGTLSIHRGSWMTQHNSFHAHFCVDVIGYLKLFNSRKSKIPNWPSKKYVTNQWKKNKDPSSYPENVRGYPYKSYLKQEVDEIGNIPKSVSDSLENGPETYEGLNVVYHPSHPKIGFRGEKVKSRKYLLEVLLIMENYAKDQGWTSGSSGGCHVCLYLGAGAQQQEWGNEVDIVGYIVTNGLQFYKMCPSNRRQLWFEAFKKSKFLCVT